MPSNHGRSNTPDIIAAEKIAFELPGGPEISLAPDKIDARLRQLVGSAERHAHAIFVDNRDALLRPA